MNTEQYIAHVKTQIDRKFAGNQSKAAKAWGLYPTHLSQILQGKLKPLGRLVEATGFEAITDYRRIDKSKQ